MEIGVDEREVVGAYDGELTSARVFICHFSRGPAVRCGEEHGRD